VPFAHTPCVIGTQLFFLTWRRIAGTFGPTRHYARRSPVAAVLDVHARRLSGPVEGYSCSRARERSTRSPRKGTPSLRNRRR
jgi:hypothetical protein